MNFAFTATFMLFSSVSLVSAGFGHFTKESICIADAVSFLVNGQDVDLMHLIDGSVSVTSGGFNDGIAATKDVTNMVNAMSTINGAHPTTGSRVGYIQFSHPWTTSLGISLPVSATAMAFNNALDLFPYDQGSRTATATALGLAGVEFALYSESRNKRVWMATDGNWNAGGNPKWAAKWMKDWGAKICVMAIGNSVNMDEIKEIASKMGGKKKCFCKLDDYHTYKEASAKALATLLVKQATVVL